MNAEADKGAKLKKVFYRAKYRGTKELDVLFGNFVNEYFEKFSLEEINEMERLVLAEESELFALFVLRDITRFDLTDSLIQKLNLYFLQR